MNLPRQAAPVMRGHDRGHQPQPSPAAEQTVGQSALPCTTICALVPAPYNTICQALCPLIP